jgi:hypothetical protein
MHDTLPLLRASDHYYTAGQDSSCGGALHDSLLELAQ